MNPSPQEGLRIRYRYHDGDIVQLSVSVWNGRFGAAADVYIGHDTLSEAATTIAGFPANNAEHREVVLGAFGAEFAGGAVALKFYCADLAGHARVLVQVETDNWGSGPTETASVICDIQAAGIDRFVAQLKEFTTEWESEAVLAHGG